MLITIHVHPLTRKMLITEQGPEPISFRRHNVLVDVLRGACFVGATPDERPNAITATITLDVPDRLARALQAAGYAPALALYRHHRELALRFMYHMATTGGMHATEAMETLYRTYDITDDDYAYDSCYRMYQRFRQDMDALFSKKGVRFCVRGVLKIGRAKSDSGTGQIPTQKQLQDSVAEARRLLLLADPRTPRYVLHQVEVYVYKEHGKRSAKWMARHFHRSPRRIRAAVQRVRGYIEVDPTFAAIISQAVGLVAVLPVAAV